MLTYEYKLAGTKKQYQAIEGAIRTVQFIRNKCLRLWMDGKHVSRNDLQCYCAVRTVSSCWIGIIMRQSISCIWRSPPASCKPFLLMEPVPGGTRKRGDNDVHADNDVRERFWTDGHYSKARKSRWASHLDEGRSLDTRVLVCHYSSENLRMVATQG